MLAVYGLARLNTYKLKLINSKTNNRLAYTATIDSPSRTNKINRLFDFILLESRRFKSLQLLH